ncbi:MAG: hypothetical protein HY735_35520 [Verrucomicrobia bacterium]|nr:hypothetical protein [Verrucomicrobiota bacterium]
MPARKWLHSWVVALSALAAVAVDQDSKSATGGPAPPNFQELYSLIASNAPGLSEATLNRAAVRGFLEALYPQVILVTNTTHAAEPSQQTTVAKAELLESSIAYLRLAAVRAGSAQAFAEAVERLRATNQLTGLILDVRFSDGVDYDEAAQVADLFFKTEQPLLKWNGSAKRSTAKQSSIGLPVMLLVNHGTSGAAEALTAVLRGAEVGLVVGSPTAGRTQAYKEFTLSTGHRLRIASSRIEVGDGHFLSETGLVPDIRVQVPEDVEKAYLQDLTAASWQGATELAAAQTPALRAGAAIGKTASRAKINESALIRQTGDRHPAETGSDADNTAAPPVVQDPALARGLDILKGLALAKRPR